MPRPPDEPSAEIVPRSPPRVVTGMPACLCCDATLSFEEIPYYYDHGLQVCDACAAHIANRYSHWHSGEYLTWPKDGPADTPSGIPEFKPGDDQ